MTEIRTIPEKIIASGVKNTSIDTIGKFSKKVIHHNAGPPTAADDTGLGYAVGSIWVDTANGDMYTATDVTAEDATLDYSKPKNISPGEIKLQIEKIVSKYDQIKNGLKLFALYF